MAQQRKRKIESECRRFQTRWANEYFFTEVSGKCVCLICQESVAVMKGYNIKRHYETKHQSFKSYTGAERDQKVKQLSAALLAQQQQHMCRANKAQGNSTLASYEVAHLMARHGTPFTEGELIKQCLVKVATVICPEKMQDFKNINLSRNTVGRRIEDLSANLKEQVRDKVPTFEFYSIACDHDSTDSTETAQLVVYLRGVDSDFCISEELLDVKSLTSTATGKDLFEAVSCAIESMNLPWAKLCGIATDGAPAMIGERDGLAFMVCSKVHESGGEAVKMHCIIHQEALFAKAIQMDDVMTTVVTTIHVIRSRALNHRELRAFLSDIDAEYGDGVYDSNNARWLSRGSALQRFYSLRAEIDQCLKHKNLTLDQLNDPDWLADLAFLVDLTSHLNALNTSLQGKDQLISEMYAHMKSFAVKLRLFERQISDRNAVHFPSLSEIISSLSDSNILGKMAKYSTMLTSLITEFNQRFQDFSAIDNDIKLFSTPFSINVEEVQESVQLELIELQCDGSLCSRHQLLPLSEFYTSLDTSRFPLIKRHAQRMMSLFGSTYICSLMSPSKSPLRASLTDSHLCDLLRISTSRLTPDLTSILKSTAQHHCSH